MKFLSAKLVNRFTVVSVR